MAPAKTIYVRDADLQLWKRFEGAVHNWPSAEGLSILITEAMRGYLDRFGDQGDGLYVVAPGEDPGRVALAEGRTAILQRTPEGWELTASEKEYGTNGEASDFFCTRDVEMGAAVEQARMHLAVLKNRQRFEDIEVKCVDRLGNVHVERFVGRWLVRPAGEKGWGVALTRRGQFAVYSDRGGEGGLDVFPTTTALRQAPLPPSVVREALLELNEPMTIDRDI